ncbi:hypothetical protein PIIN_04119 [Serendipita indica DSM 11827]|uniref:F-box domain-containing protein n=1 Tax=Serendipita indica (strain DSM 11827) TaxID=1109443 RepID=G4TFS9_SERID|nr:hypothetical protein PIIN_04119 [Serendipita indica DSM 11827]
MNNRRRRSLEDLPVELWLAIVKEATMSAPYHRYGKKLLIILTQLSQTLASPIFRASTLWGHIAVDDDVEDLETMVSLFLSLSGDCSLSLEYKYGSSSIQAVAPLLLPHVNRIHSLFMLRGAGPFPDDDPFIPDVYFPALRRLDIQAPLYYNIGPIIILRQTIPHIISFASNVLVMSPGAPFLIHITLSGHLRATGDELTDVHIHVESIEELKALTSIKSLKRAILNSNSLDSFKNPAISITGSLALTNLPTTSPLWESLHCTWASWDILENLITRCGASLIDLTMKLEMKQMTAFIRRLKDLPSLISLSVSVDWNKSEPLPTLDGIYKAKKHHLLIFLLSLHTCEMPGSIRRHMSVEEHTCYAPETVQA